MMMIMHLNLWPLNATAQTGSSAADGMYATTRSMAGNMRAMEIHSQNISNFGIPGYQGKEALRRKFVEHLGVQSIDEYTNTEVGRIRQTGIHTDLALTEAGFFQVQDAKTGAVKLTRDGRTIVNKEGYLTLATSGGYFLDANGTKIKFNTVPTNFEKQVKIDTDGSISYINPLAGESKAVGKLSVVQVDGSKLEKPKVAQGYLEDSNVMLAKEFTALVPIRREFEANRQFFLIQSDSLSRMIQELGKAQ